MGTFIAIEGGDGSGKATQTKLLVEYLRKQGKDVYQIAFPRYGEASAYYVERYLNGIYGGTNDVHAELGSLPYALDRFAAKQDIIDHLKKPNSIVVSDRYMASNLAHQGAKISNLDDRQKFYARTLMTEYDILGIPKPDMNIVLLIPADIMQANVDKKDTRSYTEQKRDIHEADANHLELAKRNFEELCEIYRNEFTPIHCISGENTMLSVDFIQTMIRERLFAI